MTILNYYYYNYKQTCDLCILYCIKHDKKCGVDGSKKAVPVCQSHHWNKNKITLKLNPAAIFN